MWLYLIQVDAMIGMISDYESRLCVDDTKDKSQGKAELGIAAPNCDFVAL